MAFVAYLRGGPEPVATGKSQDPRLITTDEPLSEIVISVEGGRQGVYRHSDENETINAGAAVATVFEFVEII